uniref:Uncharacterized protein n=1 Tax=Arundo donax TaxID=35708 RepID=A0A0A9H236_ARUDO
MILVDSEGILTWDQCYWKVYQISFSTIYRTSKTEFRCDLCDEISAGCFWISRSSQSELGLQLGLHVLAGLLLLLVFWFSP